MGSMGGTFTIPEFNSSYTISDSNLVRIGDKKIFGKKPCTPPFYLIFTSENHFNAHNSLIKPHMALNVAPLDCSRQGASPELKKIYLDFSVLEKFAKIPKNPYSWLPQQKMGSMGGTFTIPEFNSSSIITDIKLVKISDKKFLEKNHVLPPFYLIFTSENHLNAHSSLIKPHMAMNFATWDCSRQGASSEPKKIYLDFSVLEKFAKNQKIHIFGSHSKKWVQWAELLL
jgi:hypothetical protein